MTLKAVVLLLALAFLLHRFAPRRKIPWTIPLVVVGVVLTVRTGTWLTSE